MQQRGFTLIELVIVIVILGILAVTAAPRFIDLQGDARASTLQGVKAALQGGAQLVYAKSAIAGNQNIEFADSDAPSVTINTLIVPISFGYPDADEVDGVNLVAWADLNLDGDWDLTTSGDGTPTPEGTFALTPDGVAYSADADTQCQVIYQEASSPTTGPVITVQSGGC